MHAPQQSPSPMDNSTPQPTARVVQSAEQAAAALDHALETFYGQATAAEARFYARLPSHVLGPGCQLTGEVVGPFSHRTRCLPATVKFRPPLTRPVFEGPRPVETAPVSSTGAAPDSVLLEAVVPDPCFWQPEQPYYYDVSLRLQRGGETLAQVKRPLGLRPLGSHGRRFYMQGKPWVVRGVTRAAALDDDDWHAALHLGATPVVDRPGADLCNQAHRLGVLLMATAEANGSPPPLDSAAAVAALARGLASHPAVGLLLLPPTAPWSDACRAATRNVLVGCRVDPLQHAEQNLAAAIPPWAQFVALHWPDALDAATYAGLASQIQLPVCVEQTTQRFETLTAARSGCDTLQRRLAGLGDFAGYLV